MGKNGNLGGEETDGLNGKNGININDEKRNSQLNSSEDLLNKKGKAGCCKRLTNKLCSALSLIGAAIVKCAGYFFGKVSDFLTSFFFLKTNAQKKADQEFEDNQRKADKEEREAVKKKSELIRRQKQI